MLKVTTQTSSEKLSKMLDRMSAACGGRIKFQVEGPKDGEPKEVIITCGPEEVKLGAAYGMSCRGTIPEPEKGWKLTFTGEAKERMELLKIPTVHEFAAELQDKASVEECGRKMCRNLGFEKDSFTIAEMEYTLTLEGPVEKKLGESDYTELPF